MTDGNKENQLELPRGVYFDIVEDTFLIQRNKQWIIGKD